MAQVIQKSSTASALEKSAVARYLQLASLFRQRIEVGEWAVDSQIPTVEELAKQCGVAGMTIRQALEILEREGLIERFRAKGTFVRKRPSRDIWCEVQTDWNGLLMARDNARITVLSMVHNVELPPHMVEKGMPAPSYRHLRRLHTREDEPFLIADVYIDERLCDKIPEENFSKTTAMRLVADLPGVKIAEAYQQLTIDTADLETSTLLDVPLSHPVAKVKRSAVDSNGTLVLLANGIYRGDLVRIDLKLNT